MSQTIKGKNKALVLKAFDTLFNAKDLLFQPTMSRRMQALNQEAQISLYPESGHAPSTTNQSASTASWPPSSASHLGDGHHRQAVGRIAGGPTTKTSISETEGHEQQNLFL
jgi:hypothetical protein